MRPGTTAYYTSLNLPLGRFWLAATARGACALGLPAEADAFWGRLEDRFPRTAWREDPHRLRPLVAQVKAYFAGELKAFDVPLDLRATPFQRRVLERVARIPFGGLDTYGGLARALGQPTAARAVGSAVGSNPLPLLIPCHRVVGARGQLTGFGGGLPLKRALLELEGHRLSGVGVLPPRGDASGDSHLIRSKTVRQSRQ